MKGLSWLDKLPTELKLYTAIQNFDALTWFMLTDDKVFTYYTKTEQKQTFYDLFLEHEATTELVFPLFEKLYDSKFMHINNLVILKSHDNYRGQYKISDGKFTKYYEYMINCNKQMWQRWDYNGYSWSIHRDNSYDGRPLPAYISTNGEKQYYDNGTQVD